MAGSKKPAGAASKKSTMDEVKEELERQRAFVTCGADENKHTVEHAFSGAYAAVGIDNAFSVASFRDRFKPPSGRCAARPFHGLNAIPSSTRRARASLHAGCFGTRSRATVT